MKIIYILFLIVHTSLCVDNFATKTNYNDSLKIDLAENFFPVFPATKNCSAVKHVSVLYRHGTRYPSAKDVKKGRLLLQGLKPLNQYGNNTLKILEGILDKFAEKEEKALADRGFLELEEIGRKLKIEHPGLFEEFKDEDFAYYVTEKSRTVGSFEGFVKGIRHNDTYNPSPIEDNHLLRFFDECNKYIVEVDDNETAIFEYHKFMSTNLQLINEEMLKAYKDLFEPYNFTASEMKALFSLAGMEVAVFETRSWPSTFLNPASALLLEYSSDLSNYWKKGGGHEISYMQSCDYLKHLFDSFDQVFNNTSQNKGTFYFAHAETNIPLYTILGLFPDHLTADNYPLMQQRNFKTTRIIPFAGNIRFELFHCNDVPYISLHMKDFQLAWPVCQNSACPYQQVKQHYLPTILQCDFNKICLNNTASLKTFSLLLLATMVLMTIF